MPKFRANQKYAIAVAMAAVFLAVATPVFAQAPDQKTAAGAMALLSALLYAIPPWVTGLVIDFLVVRSSTILWKGLATAVLSMVLGYPSIWFSLSSFIFLPGGPESSLAWIVCAILLALTLGAVKVVAYWVVNERFPAKATAGLLFVSSTVMVAVAFLCLQFMGTPPAPGSATTPAEQASPASTETPASAGNSKTGETPADTKSADEKPLDTKNADDQPTSSEDAKPSDEKTDETSDNDKADDKAESDEKPEDKD